MLLSLRKNRLTSLFKEVRVFKEVLRRIPFPEIDGAAIESGIITYPERQKLTPCEPQQPYLMSSM